ncbi:hypothetical protein NDU88_003856 [Pleurodeles waltl]|uniref:Uncharacterized protein n=1 Tax=Pleurodeles waltl TaxID=8319 RepID=A0AAV7WTF9_PLEWA|nr:hypothetical protein NDU88_003856 [Pleurodeles waltl]
MGLTFDLEDLPFYTQGELEGFCRERGLPVEGDLRRSLNFFERFVTFTQGGSVRRGYPEDPECSEGSQWEGSQTSSLESGRETDQEGENDRLGTPVDREGPSDRESLAGSSVRSRATSHSLTPDELRDRREERDLKLQLARLAVEERRAEVEKALVQERMAEAERAFARERLALERSLKVLDSPALQVESSGGSNVQCCSKEVPHIPIDLVPRFQEGGDIRQWLKEYEKALVERRIPEKDWGTGLGSFIPEEGRDALLTLEESDREGYSAVKNALIVKYGFSPEEYRKRFRGGKKLSHQSWEEFVEACCMALDGWVKGSTVNNFEGLFNLILREHLFRCCFSELRQHLSVCELSDPRELAKEADFWLRTRGSGVTLGGVPNESGLGVSQQGVVGKEWSVPGRSQWTGMGEGPHVPSLRRGNGAGLRPKVPKIPSQAPEGSMSERQEVSLTCAVGPAVQKDPILSLGFRRVAGDSVPPVLVSGSLALQRRRRKSRHRVERGLRAPVENLEGQGSALRAEPPRNDLGETISGLGGIQTLSDGQRSGDLRQPDSCVALGESVSLMGGRCAPQEVLVRQAMIQPQGGDSGLDDQVQGVNSDLMGSTCAPKEVLVRRAVVQPQGSDSGLDCQIQGVSSDLVGGRCAPKEVLVRWAMVQSKGVVPGLDRQVQGVNSDLVGGAVSALTPLCETSGGFSRGGETQDSGSGVQGGGSPPRTPVQPKGVVPGLGGQSPGSDPGLARKLCRAAVPSTLASVDSGDTPPRRGGRDPRRRGRGRRASPLAPVEPMGADPRLVDQWQGRAPELIKNGVETGCFAPGATAPHSLWFQRPEAPRWPGAWFWPLAARESPWVGLGCLGRIDREIPVESGRRRTGTCPCCCGPGSLFYRPNQESTSRY